jgi:hypothetical protein
MGKERSVVYDLERAPGPAFVSSYETALRILGRSVPSPAQTAAGEDAEAVALAQFLARIEDRTSFDFEAEASREESAFEKAGRGLPAVLLNDSPSRERTAATLDLLYQHSLARGPSYADDVHELIREMLLLPTLRTRFGARLLDSLELFAREGRFYATALRLLGRPLLPPSPEAPATADHDARFVAGLLSRLQPDRFGYEARAFVDELERRTIAAEPQHGFDLEYFLDGFQALRRSNPRVRSAVEELVSFPPLRERLGAGEIQVLDLFRAQDPFYDLALKALGRPLFPAGPQEHLSADPEAAQLAGLLRALREASPSADYRKGGAADRLEKGLTWAEADPAWYREEAQILDRAGKDTRAALRALLGFPALRAKWGALLDG